ncbi:NAD(P)H-hydrate dehydratase [Sphingomonas flavalba]|uniref:NAD(P)H-hydrate dehydratase n=1 Tax=Sphingomonas flavalba TaxID=2559804 RepID=UPI0039E1BC60
MAGLPVLTAAETRAAEAAAIAAGTSVTALMDRAGRAVADLAWRIAGAHYPILILCGPGNNGGDGYVAARILGERGAPVTVAALADPTTDAARAARGGWSGPVVPLAAADPAFLVIDALFGTGLTRPLSAEVEAALAIPARHRIAVDVPSGVATDDGALLGAVPRYTATLALGALKPAHLLQPAAGLCGRLFVADIGLSASASVETVVRPVLAPPSPADHKYTRGLVAVVGGAMPGAARLAASAAAHAGAGYVLLLGAGGGGLPDAVVTRPADVLPEVVADRRLGALLVGPGLGADGAAPLAAALRAAAPLVVDGDALRQVTPEALADRTAPTVLTPHDGEFAALFGALPGSKIDRARAAAARADAVVIAKGADTVIAAPDGRVRVADGASPWLSTAGTGDVLAGIVAAQLARGLAPLAAAETAVWLHGEAARRAGPAFVADALVARLPAALGAAL